MQLRAASFYANEVRPSLPSHAFSPVPSRLGWLALHVLVIALGVIALARGWGGWWAAPVWSLVIGHSFAGCAFVGHETLHGAVVRHRGLRHAIGWICFLPFTLSPRLWVAWHNKTHHAHTMSVTDDPDCFPTLERYHQSRLLRLVDRVAFAARRPAGGVTLGLGFSGQILQMLLRWSRQHLSAQEQRLAYVETLAGFAVWGTVAYFVGPLGFLFAYVLPLVVGNFVVISYILTNHSLSPLTEVNDPLVNSLSVSVPSVLARLHLNFGLHVEHHLFPSMSSAYAPLVRDQLQARYPDRYQSLPLVEALRRLARTPRVYATPTVLEDPRTGQQAPTLLPG